MRCNPAHWVGLGFVATIENAPAEVLSEIEGISSVAAQVAWGVNAQKPDRMESYLSDLADWDLNPIGWGWCDGLDSTQARNEGYAHARIASELPIKGYIANMEEPYDAHGNATSPKYDLCSYYCDAFRSVLPNIEFAVTTTPRWASNHQELRDAGATHMPQAFSGEVPSATVDNVCAFSGQWGWPMDRVRPLCQVYETRGQVPDPGVYLSESADWEVGLVPYILEQALGGAGRASLSALVPAITRPPSSSGYRPPTNGDDMQRIGSQHGIEATYSRFKALDPAGCNPKFDPKNPAVLPLEQLKAYDKWCRTMLILVQDHDAQA